MDRGHIEALREKAWKKIPLTETEQADLTLWHRKREEEEMVRLRPAFERMAEERRVQGNYRRQLEELLQRKYDAYERLKRLVEEIDTIKKEETLLALTATDALGQSV